MQYDPAITNLGIYYPVNLKTCVYIKIYLWMFYSSFIHNWQKVKTTNFLQKNEKLWYIYTMKYYSEIKKKWVTEPQKHMEKPEMHITKWKNPVESQLSDILEKAKP